MTITDTTARTSAVGSGSAGQVIPFTFPASATSEIVVRTRVTATGIPATLKETTDYSVTLNGDSGGSVTLVAALAATSEVFIIRNTALTQTLDLTHGGTFSAENQEDAFDKNTKLSINLKDKADRALLAPDTDPTTLNMTLPNSVDRAGYVLGFNSVTGEPEAVEVDNIAPAVLGTSYKLLSTTTVSFATAADTTIYTVPANARLVPHFLIVVAYDTAGATTTLSCGQDGAETDFVPAHTLSNLDQQEDAVIIQPAVSTTPAKLKSYAAGTVIQVQVASPSGAAGNKVFFFGMLYSDPSWTTTTTTSTTTSTSTSTSSSTSSTASTTSSTSSTASTTTTSSTTSSTSTSTSTTTTAP